MARKRKRTYRLQPQRPEPVRPATGHTFLIVVEGEATEVAYFGAARAKLEREAAAVVVCHGDHTDPIGIVREAIKLRDAQAERAAKSLRNEAYDQTWVVFDRERQNHPRREQVALTKPSESERGQWYFQRYTEQLPTAGEIVFFDRSWYNRAGVEHVMGFCSPHQYLEFMRQAPEFERMLVRSGIHLFKFWFSVSREEQLRRFLGRANDPLKQWKLSPMDVESLGRWEAYTKAKEDMLFYTDTADAPWTIVRSDDKNRARLHAMRHILSSIPYAGKDEATVQPPDPRVVGSAKTIYETGEKHHS